MCKNYDNINYRLKGFVFTIYKLYVTLHETIVKQTKYAFYVILNACASLFSARAVSLYIVTYIVIVIYMTK